MGDLGFSRSKKSCVHMQYFEPRGERLDIEAVFEMFISGWGAEVNFSVFAMCVTSIVFRLQTVRLHVSFIRTILCTFMRTTRLRFAQKLRIS